MCWKCEVVCYIKVQHERRGGGTYLLHCILGKGDAMLQKIFH